ncbi:MAG TPA: glycosyltransferase family 2 protein [Leptolyngbyaceae cyanobacterium]
MELPAFQTPIALLIFKRPKTTSKVLEVLRQIRPVTLLVISNLPPENKPDQLKQCQETRALIDQIDWPCRVLKNYAETYLSCKERISSGLNWVFETVDRAIILEDDCIPDLTFFQYCEELLDRYAEDERVMAITGDNFNIPPRQPQYSYFFSRHTQFWGWATWRRAWQYYDITMRLLPEFLEAGWLSEMFQEPAAIRWWEKTLQEVYSGQKDTWDYQWDFSCWIRGAACIVPRINLVSNIGFDKDAAHNRDAFDWRANLPTSPIELPLKHPPFVRIDEQCDRILQKRYYGYIAQKQTRPLNYRVTRKLYRAKMLLADFRQQPTWKDLPNLIKTMVKE